MSNSTDLLNASTSLLSNAVNMYNVQSTNEANKEINQSVLDYNSAMTQQAWERDDRAHQREVADLQAAGLSPIANMQGLQTSNPLGAPQPIAMQAPQMDTNALINAFTQSSAISETQRHNKAIETQRDTELDIEAGKLDNEAQRLNIQNKDVESQIKYRVQLNQVECDKVAETIRAHKKDEELRLSAQQSLDLERESKRYYEEIKKQAGGDNVPYKVINDFEIFYHYKKLYNLQLSNFIKEIGATQSASAESYGYNQSDSVGVGAGAKVAGTGGHGSLNWSESTGETTSQYSSENWSEKQKAMWYKWQQEHPVPIFISKEKYPNM